MTQLTLIAEGRAAEAPGLAARYRCSHQAEGDAGRLGRLYFDAGVPYAELADAGAAAEEIRAFFRGEFGDFAAASGVIEHDGQLVAACSRCTGHRGTTPRTARSSPICSPIPGSAAGAWPGCWSPGPWMRCTAPRGAVLALRVESGNAAAVHLYQGFGFRPYARPGSRAAR